MLKIIFGLFVVASFDVSGSQVVVGLWISGVNLDLGLELLNGLLIFLLAEESHPDAVVDSGSFGTELQNLTITANLFFILFFFPVVAGLVEVLICFLLSPRLGIHKRFFGDPLLLNIIFRVVARLDPYFIGFYTQRFQFFMFALEG